MEDIINSLKENERVEGIYSYSDDKKEYIKILYISGNIASNENNYNEYMNMVGFIFKINDSYEKTNTSFKIIPATINHDRITLFNGEIDSLNEGTIIYDRSGILQSIKDNLNNKDDRHK